MFALTPWRKERRARALLPRNERFRLMNEFESLFEPLFRWPLLEPEEMEVPWGITAEETEKEVVVRAEVPGFEPGELAVWVSGEELTVEARHEEPVPKEKEKEPKAEARFAHVRRVITLPPTVNREKGEATYRHGVLEVRFPKVPEAVGRRIEVKT
jgi:HSP20 family protein